ncbi:beta-amyrin 11-oxidase-like isoform X1 [Cucumis melo var. makuwa]|uniref:Beta-amyrin 11-oxidase-like isoform X1 n=1 Tax=Cucumis melo var. makuwa TaxID=1194695 RepID=A0A5A7UBF0_CUCMM|nr:beta-amyrin 11-oxidase-like isoform X1 [Cucumis melo var. makuwa]TYK11517.1 beta-amyrin 11-oxidase-like isoform X1 [Cucumis melo var. makuwa]
MAGFGVLKRLNNLYYALKLGKKWDELPPGDLSWPLVGSTLSFLKYFTFGPPESFIADFSRRYGKLDMYKTHIFGKPTIIVCKPEICRQVLLTEEAKFIPGYPITMTTIFGRKSLHQVPKEEHRKLRRLTTAPISGHAALEMYIDHIEHTVISGLEEWSRTEKPLELLTTIKHLTLKVIWNIFMGSTPIKSTSIREMENLNEDIALAFFTLPINFPGFPFHKALMERTKIISNTNATKSRKRLNEILQSILDEKRMVKKSKGENWKAKDMMDLLMEVRDEDGEGFDDETITEMIFSMLFGGQETSAFTTMWAVLFLTDNPHIFQKAKEEQEDIVRRRASTQKGVSLSEIKQMKYLSQVIDETLRLGSIAFATFREATTDVEINGKIIPKGWKVILWLRELYMDEKLHPSPQQFNPSRWDNFTGSSGAFTPFGLGVRMCPGRDLARIEISIFLHYFVLNYKVERLNAECELNYLPIAYPKDKCLARVIKAPSKIH